MGASDPRVEAGHARAGSGSVREKIRKGILAVLVLTDEENTVLGFRSARERKSSKRCWRIAIVFSRPEIN
jgi:hypothetical protein